CVGSGHERRLQVPDVPALRRGRRPGRVRGLRSVLRSRQVRRQRLRFEGRRRARLQRPCGARHDHPRRDAPAAARRAGRRARRAVAQVVGRDLRARAPAAAVRGARRRRFGARLPARGQRARDLRGRGPARPPRVDPAATGHGSRVASAPMGALRVAVVGSGPAGFYAAGALLAADVPVEVDLIERLPTPWGLVRLGVAPDHPKIKSVSRAFEKIAVRPGFRFLGNVEVGRDVQHDQLLEHYDAVVYAVGAQTDRRMNIPGEDLPGSWAATEFVAWYNGHPDFQELEFDLSGERAVVIGNGNVAVDVARMLALTPEELATTDTTQAAIDAFNGAGIREVVMVGRRGPAQAAFTTPELIELGELAGADVIVDPADHEGAEPTDTNSERHLEVLRGFAAREPEGKAKRLVLRFLRSPVAILGEERVEAIELVHNRLEADEHGALRAVPTGEIETLPCGIVFRSVGYRGVALPGVPFDDGRG